MPPFAGRPGPGAGRAPAPAGGGGTRPSRRGRRPGAVLSSRPARHARPVPPLAPAPRRVGACSSAASLRACLRLSFVLSSGPKTKHLQSVRRCPGHLLPGLRTGAGAGESDRAGCFQTTPRPRRGRSADGTYFPPQDAFSFLTVSPDCHSPERRPGGTSPPPASHRAGGGGGGGPRRRWRWAPEGCGPAPVVAPPPPPPRPGPSCGAAWGTRMGDILLSLLSPRKGGSREFGPGPNPFPPTTSPSAPRPAPAG